MKKLVFLFSLIGILFSCNSDDDSSPNADLVGNWKITEVLADPGDGSGTFSPVESNKVITFHQDGKITSNGTLCDTSIETNSPSSGTYSLSESTFNTPNCGHPEYEYQFEHNGKTLIIIYPCFEACQVKYKKI